MKYGSSRGLIAAAILLCLAGTPSAMAQQKKEQQKTTINKAEAAKQARKQVNGRVLKVDQNHDRYRVKVLQKSGRVVSVDVDKKSGKVSKKKKDNK